MGFLELSVGARSFSINAMRVWMDCNASASSAFRGAEVVWLGVGVVSICGGVGGRGVCFVWVVARCAQMWGGPGVAVSRCVCDDASRRLSFCCTCANMSFLSAKAASIEKD